MSLSNLYIKAPINPPKVFNITSSISAVLPIRIWANSIEQDTKNDITTVGNIFLVFINLVTNIPKGINKIMFPSTFLIKSLEV